MPRYNLSNGRWILMRLPTVNEHLAFTDLPDVKALPPEQRTKANVERLRFFRDTFRAATLALSSGR